MRSYSRKRKNNIIIGTLCGVMLLMVVGYAAFASRLDIKGTSGISSNWDIEITNIRGGNPYGGDAYDISEPTYTPTTAIFNTGLITPLDENWENGSDRWYEVEVTNKGTLTGLVTIANLSCGDNDAIGCQVMALGERWFDDEWVNLIQSEPEKWTDINEGQQDYSDIAFTLDPGEKHYLYVNVYYSNSVTNQPENLSASINMELTYEQAVDSESGNKIPNRPTETVNLKGNDITTTMDGDGLYKDKYELGRYFYKGTNPDNYITFNDEIWRIISLEVDGTLKIIKNGDNGTNTFDSSNSNKWARPATLNTRLNQDYYQNNIKDSYKDLIVEHEWNVGPSGSTSLKALIDSEKSVSWNGKIGLISLSEFIRINSNARQCGTEYLYNSNSDICKSTHFLNINWSRWTLTPTNSPNCVVTLWADQIGSSAVNETGSNAHAITPVVYLKSDIILSGGGTSDDPYIIN